MNKAWRNLLIIGIIALGATIAWEIYQAADGGRENFNPFVNQLPNDELFSDELEKHIQDGQANLVLNEPVVQETDETILETEE